MPPQRLRNDPEAGWELRNRTPLWRPDFLMVSRNCTGGRRNSVPVGVETNIQLYPFSREPLRVVRAECKAARTTMPSVPPIGQLAQLSEVLEKKVHSS